MADLVITAANVVRYDGAETARGLARETITAGQVLYRHTDGKVYKALDDTAAHADCIGVALCNASADQPVVYATVGEYNPGAAVTVGEVYGLTDTAGGVGLISERNLLDFITVLGVATTTSRIDIKIDVAGIEAYPNMVVTGVLDPDVTGTYTYVGLYDGYGYWAKATNAYLFVDTAQGVWVLAEYLAPVDPGVEAFWGGPVMAVASPVDDYSPVAPATGDATVAEEV